MIGQLSPSIVQFAERVLHGLKGDNKMGRRKTCFYSGSPLVPKPTGCETKAGLAAGQATRPAARSSKSTV